MTQVSERTKSETRALKDLKFSYAENWRNNGNPEVDLAISSMVEDVLREGRIHTPLLINGETNEVLRGFRRGTAALRIVADGKAPQEVVKNLEKLSVVAMYGLTPKREMELRYDDGGFKQLNKSEIVRAYFRFLDKMFDKDTIYAIMYQSLARYTGKTEKIAKVETLKGTERAQYLRDWFKGTCEQFFLYAYELGRTAQECLVLSELAKERALTEAEQAQMICKLDRARVKELRTIQKEAGNDSVAAKMLEYGKVDRGEVETAAETKRLTEADTKSKVQGFGSDEIKTALLATVSGDDAAKARERLAELDHILAARGHVLSAIKANVEAVKCPHTKAIFLAVLYPNKDSLSIVETAFKAIKI